MITFSKRRSGIHKKASELVTLTGAEIGIVRIGELNQQHNELLCWLDEENAREKILNQNRKGKETQPHWWETPVDELKHQEPLQMDAAVDLHKTFLAKLYEKPAATSSSMAPPMYFHHK
ncbi:Agamous-like MADS-box protein AGL61 [Citrus sinensis]|uniref:Agamous-like MADS-box protein AGL61 n=1 Tax=Citrus sinensis TaxID=2711 RepID=A0ACB8HWZ4_CITSI|nr:Agamous-like MADS-box protein AGL61 [Citrus sinensis]